MYTFEDYYVWISGDERVNNAVKGGCLGPFLGVVAEDDTGRAAGIYYHKANGEASIH